MLRRTCTFRHYRIHRDLKLLELAGGWASQDMLRVYVHLAPPIYRDEAGHVSLSSEAPKALN